MYKLTLKSDFGEIVFGGELYTPYTITEIEGIASPEATINLSDLALLDGQKFNSAKANTRTINIAFAIEYGAEANRLNVYKVIRVKKPLRMIYKSELRNVYIDGYVSQVEVSHFDIKQVVTVTLICPQPYFRAVNEVIDQLGQNIRAFHFPFAITADDPVPLGIFVDSPIVTVMNTGEADTGIIFDISIYNSVEGITITDTETGEFFKVNGSFNAGTRLIISTVPGDKYVTYVYGSKINRFSSVAPGSTWFVLSDTRTFVYSLDSGDLGDIAIEINHEALFEGV